MNERTIVNSYREWRQQTCYGKDNSGSWSIFARHVAKPEEVVVIESVGIDDFYNRYIDEPSQPLAPAMSDTTLDAVAELVDAKAEIERLRERLTQCELAAFDMYAGTGDGTPSDARYCRYLNEHDDVEPRDELTPMESELVPTGNEVYQAYQSLFDGTPASTTGADEPANDDTGMSTKQKHQLLAISAKRFVSLGDDPGIFMTCESGHGIKPCIRLGCQNLEHAHAVHRALIDIVEAARQIDGRPATTSDAEGPHDADD